MNVEIRLPGGVWTYDPQQRLGQVGGFGAVYLGGTPENPLAIKKLHIDAAAAVYREMRLMTELAGRNLKHVIPIFDSGQDADSSSYFVVMPKATGTLADEIGRRSFSAVETAEVLSQIALGLSEVQDTIHRDLKPANILLHDGLWKVADFGIARFVEESTSLATLKGCLSPQYAAPEQWQMDRSTSATDLYSLGCIGYALLNGCPPFHGSFEELKERHLTESPPVLPDDVSPRLRSLLSWLLRKTPDGRPTLSRVMSVLQEVRKEGTPGSPDAAFGSLLAANLRATHAQSEGIRLRAERGAAALSRQKIGDQGKRILAELLDDLGEKISKVAPIARIERLNPWQAVLGDATLAIAVSAETIPENAFHSCGWDVVREAVVTVRQIRPPYFWSANLWYVRLPGKTNYRWYEVSYFRPLSAEQQAPYSISDWNIASSAAGRGMHSVQIACLLKWMTRMQTSFALDGQPFGRLEWTAS